MERTHDEFEKLEKMKKNMDNTKALICITDNSILSFGKGYELISLYSQITKELKENGIPENIIKSVVDFAIKDSNKKQDEKISEADKLNKVIDKIESLLKEL